MSRDEIESMPAGRKMDALIAEKVMGWLRDQLLLETWLECTDCGYYVPGRKIGWLHYLEFMPSTDLIASQRVAEKLEIIVQPTEIPGEWVVTRAEKTYLDGRIEFKFEVKAETTPQAICRAALLVSTDKRYNEHILYT